MPIATVRIECMEKKLTLRDVVDSVDRIAAILTERINALDEKFEAKFDLLNARFDMLEKRTASLEYQVRGIKTDIKEIKERTNRSEVTMYAMQKDAETFHSEMRGVHKVIDRFNGRITRLEVHAGFPVEVAEE
jgi:predicted  nucleic acid-binding Zn-ribbon protein